MIAAARAFRWPAVLAWLALIFWLSHQSVLPDVGPGDTDLLFKKAGHVVVYAVLAMLFVWALHRPPGPPPRRVLLLAFALTVLYAISDEIHQTFVPGRGGHAIDVALDATAAALGLWLASQLTRRRGSGPIRPVAGRADCYGG
ncbi:MAG TPA: VanZ family protein [Dehalococcoidia bacterium]|nr:VanZ family protein [Dehalococcoidia bacterium]